jgi:transcriptional regulator with GAF, ATPase, and Fis domain
VAPSFSTRWGELPLGLQSKLLRALQEREIRRVGGTKQIPVDVRLLAATNRDLGESVRKREFREDLFYRVNVIQVVLPPLRDRTGDVPLLASHFLRRYGRNRECPLEGIDTEVLAVLKGYAWPGNIRELQNVIERACWPTGRRSGSATCRSTCGAGTGRPRASPGRTSPCARPGRRGFASSPKNI